MGLNITRNIKKDLLGGRDATINSKRKGDANELRVAKELSEWTGHEFVRVPRSGGLRWKNAQNICGDVISTDPSFDFIFSVETKHLKAIKAGERLRRNSKIYTILDQAYQDAKRSGKLPLLLIRGNGMPKGEYWVFMLNFIIQPEGLFKVYNISNSTMGMYTAPDQRMYGIYGLLWSELKIIPYEDLYEALKDRKL